MSRFVAYWANTWHLTRGSGAGGVAPIPPVINPGPDSYDTNGVYLGVPAVATYSGGKFSLTANMGVISERIIPYLQMGIAAPNGTRQDAGFYTGADVVSRQTVRALDQTANATGSWTAFLTYSKDGSTYLSGPSLVFTIASLT